MFYIEFPNHSMFYKGRFLKRNRLSESVPSASKPAQREAGTKKGLLVLVIVPSESSGLALGFCWPHKWLGEPLFHEFPVWYPELVTPQSEKCWKKGGWRVAEVPLCATGCLADILVWKHNSNKCSKGRETYLVQIGRKTWKIIFSHLLFWSMWFETYCISILIDLLPKKYMEMKAGKSITKNNVQKNVKSV